MATTTAQPLTAAPTATTKPALDGIVKLKRKAKDAIDEGFQAIAEAASRDAEHTGIRLAEQNSLAELVDGTAWLASDLVDVLLKIAAGHKPQAVMRSDLAHRIQEAEVRLELLGQLSR